MKQLFHFTSYTFGFIISLSLVLSISLYVYSEKMSPPSQQMRAIIDQLPSRLNGEIATIHFDLDMSAYSWQTLENWASVRGWGEAEKVHPVRGEIQVVAKNSNKIQRFEVHYLISESGGIAEAIVTENKR